MSICVALCCVSAYISIPLPFTTEMIKAMIVVMNMTVFILKRRPACICRWNGRIRQTVRTDRRLYHCIRHHLSPCQLVKRPEKFLYTLFSYCSHHRDSHHVSGRSHFYDAGTAGNVLAGLCHGRIPIHSRRYCQSCPGCVFRGADQYALSRLTILLYQRLRMMKIHRQSFLH